MEYTSRRNLYCTGKHADLEHADLDDGGYESDENANKKPFTYIDECVAVEVTKVQEKPVSLEVSFSNQSAQHQASSKTWTDVAGFEVSKEKKGEDSHFVFKILLGHLGEGLRVGLNLNSEPKRYKIVYMDTRLPTARGRDLPPFSAISQSCV